MIEFEHFAFAPDLPVYPPLCTQNFFTRPEDGKTVVRQQLAVFSRGKVTNTDSGFAYVVKRPVLPLPGDTAPTTLLDYT